MVTAARRAMPWVRQAGFHVNDELLRRTPTRKSYRLLSEQREHVYKYGACMLGAIQGSQGPELPLGTTTTRSELTISKQS
jgi:hypothetical protein